MCCLPVCGLQLPSPCASMAARMCQKSVGCDISMPLEDDEKQVVANGRSLASFWVLQCHLWLYQSQLVRLMRLPVDPQSCSAQAHPNFCSMLETAAVFLRKCQGPHAFRRHMPTCREDGKNVQPRLYMLILTFTSVSDPEQERCDMGGRCRGPPSWVLLLFLGSQAGRGNSVRFWISGAKDRGCEP